MIKWRLQPFLAKVNTKAVIQLGLLPTPDDLRRVVASIAEESHGDGVIRKARAGETLRRVERVLGRYGKPVKDCLKLFGL